MTCYLQTKKEPQPEIFSQWVKILQYLSVGDTISCDSISIYNGTTRIWISPYTISKLGNNLGYTPENIAHKNQANGYVGLNSSSLIPSEYLPSIVISNTYIDVNMTAMLTGTRNIGDISVRTDSTETFILKSTPSSVRGHWILLQTPSSAPIMSVNSRTGNIVLTQTDVGIPSFSNGKWLKSGTSSMTWSDIIWGNITGTLSNQSDLNSALSSKEPSISSGTSTQFWRGDKTFSQINLTNSVTGTLPIASGGTGQTSQLSALNALLPSQSAKANYVLKSDGTNANWATMSSTEIDPIFSASPAYGITASDTTKWSVKQPQLVSGTNIKTLNGNSLLGSGNIVISTGSLSYNDTVGGLNPNPKLATGSFVLNNKCNLNVTASNSGQLTDIISSVNLYSLPNTTGSYNYIWKYHGSVIGNSQNAYASDTGTYFVYVTDSKGCVGVGSTVVGKTLVTSASQLGVVQVDGSTITANSSGVISSHGGGGSTFPAKSTYTLTNGKLSFTGNYIELVPSATDSIIGIDTTGHPSGTLLYVLFPNSSHYTLRSGLSVGGAPYVMIHAGGQTRTVITQGTVIEFQLGYYSPPLYKTSWKVVGQPFISGSSASGIYVPENVSNKSNQTRLGTSTILYPSQYAVKHYVDSVATGGGSGSISREVKNLNVKITSTGVSQAPTITSDSTKTDSTKISKGAVNKLVNGILSQIHDTTVYSGGGGGGVDSVHMPTNFQFQRTNALIGIGTTSPSSYMSGYSGLAIHGAVPAVGLSDATDNWLIAKNGNALYFFNTNFGDYVMSLRSDGFVTFNGLFYMANESDNESTGIWFKSGYNVIRQNTSHNLEILSYRGGLNSAALTVQSSNGNIGLSNSTPGELLTIGYPGGTAGVMSLAGSSSGKAIIQTSAAAGSPTLTLPTVTGTIPVIDGNNNLLAPHFGGSSSAPTIAAGAGAGTGAGVSLATGSNDAAGQIIVTTGTGCTYNANVVRVTFNISYSSAPFVVFSPANNNSAWLDRTSLFVSGTTTYFDIINYTLDTAPLDDNTQYKWNYIIVK